MTVNALQQSLCGIYTFAPVKDVAWHEGDVVRKLRIAAGLTLEQLAALSSLSFTTIAAMEIGKTREPKRETIAKLALAFGLSERELRDMVPQQAVRLKTSHRTTHTQKQAHAEFKNMRGGKKFRPNYAGPERRHSQDPRYVAGKEGASK